MLDFGVICAFVQNNRAIMRTPNTHFAFSSFFLLISFFVQAQTLKGTVTDGHGRPLGYASISIKGSNKGATTNNDGKYQIELMPGDYVVACNFIGYGMQERSINLLPGEIRLVDFTLQETQVELAGVDVKAGADDPAYEIMRQAIAKRKEHLEEKSNVQSTVYMKGLIRSLKLPKSVMGQKVQVNHDIFDSSGKGIIYFSESLTRYTKRSDGAFKEEVVSARVSGNSNGFGFNSPRDLDLDFYENNISLEGMNSRGFISPLNDNAFHFYRFRYMGSFYEDGKEVNKIKVVPKRAYEPLFAGGYINIIEKSWRIHSLELTLNKASQIEVVDSLVITQEMLAAEDGIWLPRYTRIVAGFGLLGFRAMADFAAVHSGYNLRPQAAAFWKGNIVKIIDTSANKKTVQYWDSIRPVPLSVEEAKDYVKKDSLEKKFTDPRYLDSLDRKANRVNVMGLLLQGQTFSQRSKKKSFYLSPLLTNIQYNTVEQWAVCLELVIRSWRDTGAYTFSPRIRYNTGLNRFYADFSLNKRIGKAYNKRWEVGLSGGRYMFQINPDNPIGPLNNTLATLLYTTNYMKVYEKSYGGIFARKALGGGFTLSMRASFEERRPLENTDTTYKWRTYKDRSFTSNYPEELPEGNFELHQAFLTGLTLRFQPGVRYIQYPNRTIPIGSNAPVFTLSLTKAWANVFGADEQFGKWRFTVSDGFNMKLGGSVKYNLGAGGFIQNNHVQLPDYQHFMGNQTIVASPFVRGFQLAPYYANSTADGLYANGHLEWHLNGLITNKIPVFRRTNIGLVTGTNAFYVDKNRNYSEIFVGLENILKFLRVDYVWGYDGYSGKWVNGVVLGFGGLIGGNMGD